VFENRVLRRMFESERDELTEGWRKLHNDGLHNLNFLPMFLRLSNQGGWSGQSM
jgi:hypothetical protein